MMGERLKKITLRFTRNVSVGTTTRVAFMAKLDARVGGRIKVGEGCQILEYAMLLAYGGTIEMGNECSVNPFSILYGHGGLKIGNKVRIAAHTVIIPANHVFNDRERLITDQGQVKRGVTIEDDVWIGAGVRILDGVKIAKGCVLAAGAVVAKSTEAFGVYAGVPARRISERHSA
jgi:acetyltransferase-like isoleucine patch superfamily enzyme